MQRLNEDDLAGMLLQEDTWSHLNLPAIAEEDQDIAIGPGVVYHRKQNEVLHPEREPLSVLQNIKREMGSIPFSSQFQQRPIPLQGNVVKRGWLKWYTSAPVREDGAEVVQSWDVASTAADTGDWSVCSTWMVKRRTYYLLDVWRGRLEFPALKRKLIELAREWAPNRILIERAGPGLHLIQELLANPVPDVPAPIGINPEGCKRARMEAQSARFEAGQVYLPEQGPWLGEFLNEVLGFPSTRHDDQVDSTSQFLGWAEKRHRWDSPLSTYAGRDLVRYLDGCVVIG
jgi:predicted phage terminase large subunit-like protein